MILSGWTSGAVRTAGVVSVDSLVAYTGSPSRLPAKRPRRPGWKGIGGNQHRLGARLPVLPGKVAVSGVMWVKIRRIVWTMGVSF